MKRIVLFSVVVIFSIIQGDNRMVKSPGAPSVLVYTNRSQHAKRILESFDKFDIQYQLTDVLVAGEDHHLYIIFDILNVDKKLGSCPANLLNIFNYL